jgi:hypothetical protein
MGDICPLHRWVVVSLRFLIGGDFECLRSVVNLDFTKAS